MKIYAYVKTEPGSVRYGRAEETAAYRPGERLDEIGPLVSRHALCRPWRHGEVSTLRLIHDENVTTAREALAVADRLGWGER